LLRQTAGFLEGQTMDKAFFLSSHESRKNVYIFRWSRTFDPNVLAVEERVCRTRDNRTSHKETVVSLHCITQKEMYIYAYD
jgi:hypothetical protein